MKLLVIVTIAAILGSVSYISIAYNDLHKHSEIK